MFKGAGLRLVAYVEIGPRGVLTRQSGEVAESPDYVENLIGVVGGGVA